MIEWKIQSSTNELTNYGWRLSRWFALLGPLQGPHWNLGCKQHDYKRFPPSMNSWLMESLTTVVTVRVICKDWISYLWQTMSKMNWIPGGITSNVWYDNSLSLTLRVWHFEWSSWNDPIVSPNFDLGITDKSWYNAVHEALHIGE